MQKKRDEKAQIALFRPFFMDKLLRKQFAPGDDELRDLGVKQSLRHR